MSIKNVKVIGIVGGSGSGKTTFAKNLIGSIESDLVSMLGQDSYYIDQSAKFDGDGGSVNFDHPQAIDFDLMGTHIDRFKNGNAIEVPIYDFATHSRSREFIELAPTPILVIDGTLLLHQSELRGLIDHSVFIQIEEQIRFERRLKRDVLERGRTKEGVKLQFDGQVKPMHDLFVEPQIGHAHHTARDQREIDLALSQLLAILETHLS
jgi:uridine kinase